MGGRDERAVGTDPRGVQVLDYATPRPRSDLRTFRTTPEADWVAGLRGELGWLGGELGQARDADALLLRRDECAAAA